MLHLQHINKSFSSKIIFDGTQFIANPNELTILIGPSGAGKTTLFNIILNIENCDYTFNNDNISDLDKKEKEQFILDNISYASQKPTFIADLKMNDQIALLKQIYGNDYDVSELISLFELNKLLDCYPNQLSGGEKSRFAFILALLKPARIYMFDEPTSALDDLQASHIVTVLNDLKKRGNIVIISTHDHRLIEQGDKVFRIEDKKLNVIRKNDNNKQSNETKTLNKYHLKGLFNYWLKMKQHHKFYNACMTLLVTFGIVVSVCGIEYGYFVKNTFNSRINNYESKLLIVDKKLSNDYEYENSKSSFHFEDEDYTKLNEVKNIKGYYYHLDYKLCPNYISPDSKLSMENIEFLNYDENDREVNISLGEKDKTLTFGCEYYDKKAAGFMTYPNEIDFKDKIYEQWNEEGLVVSYEFYEDYLSKMIKKESDKKEITLSFPLYIPQYNGRGMSQKGSFLANAYYGIFQQTDFKIKAVLKSQYKSIIELSEYNIPTYSFALSNDEMQKYIDANKVNDSWDCVHAMKEGKYYCGIDKNKVELNRDNSPIEIFPWEPNTFVVEVDDYKNLRSVKEELENKGFNVFSQFIQVDDFVTMENAVRNNVLIFSCSVFFIILMISLFLKLNNKKDEMSFSLYFKEKGFTKKMITKMNSQRFLLNMIDGMVVSIFMYIFLNILLVFFMHIYLFVEVKGIIVGLILIILIEYIIPMCLEHYYSKEETSC